MPRVLDTPARAVKTKIAPGQGQDACGVASGPTRDAPLDRSGCIRVSGAMVERSPLSHVFALERQPRRCTAEPKRLQPWHPTL